MRGETAGEWFVCVCGGGGGGGGVLFVFVFEGKSVGERGGFFVVVCTRHLILLTPNEGLDQKLLTMPLLASVLVSAQKASG